MDESRISEALDEFSHSFPLRWGADKGMTLREYIQTYGIMHAAQAARVYDLDAGSIGEYADRLWHRLEPW